MSFIPKFPIGTNWFHWPKIWLFFQVNICWILRQIFNFTWALFYWSFWRAEQSYCIHYKDVTIEATMIKHKFSNILTLSQARGAFLVIWIFLLKSITGKRTMIEVFLSSCSCRLHFVDEQNIVVSDNVLVVCKMLELTTLLNFVQCHLQILQSKAELTQTVFVVSSKKA